MDNQRLLNVFLDVQRGLPRQGPGDEASTLRALSMCGVFPGNIRLLDIGCGPGAQTMALAKAPVMRGGFIVAVDIFEEYLDQLRLRAAETGLAEKVQSRRADMNDLPFEDESFNIIWSEGAAYSMGVDNALRSWRRLLKPGGRLAFSELVWLKPDPPTAVADFFAAEYPAMIDIEGNIKLIEFSGYELLDHFTLPEAAWWDDYYTPLEAKLPAMRDKYAGDEDALGVVETTAKEIHMRREFGEWYGYEMYICRWGLE